MPANRSRTQRWREQLDLILARGGGLELSLDRAASVDQTPDLVWRVRILQVNEDSILVEMPGAAGASVELPVGSGSTQSRSRPATLLLLSEVETVAYCELTQDNYMYVANSPSKCHSLP